MINPPKILQVQPTNRCNLYCLFCDHRKPTKELSDEKWESIVREAGEMRVARLTITGGGEPLLRKNALIRMVKQAKSFDMKGDVVTNGTLFTRDLIEVMIKYKWDDIVMSVHGPTPTIDNFLRGHPRAHQMTIRSIKKINKLKKNYNSNFPHLGFLVVLTKQNYKYAVKMVEFAHKLSVESVSFKLVNENPSEKRFTLSLRERKKLIELLKKSVERGREKSVKVFLDFEIDDLFRQTYEFDGAGGTIYCIVPFFEIVIFSDGKCVPCCVLYERENSAENEEIRKIADDITHKTLKEVWFGEKFRKIRKMMIRNKPPSVCFSCPPDTRYRHKTWLKFLKGENVRYI